VIIELYSVLIYIISYVDFYMMIPYNYYNMYALALYKNIVLIATNNFAHLKNNNLNKKLL
jgi:hypothetical protein